MRIRTSLAALAALASVAAGQTPARAATNLTVTIDFAVNCFGCGYSTATSQGTCYGYCEWDDVVCLALCHFTNTEVVYSAPPTCPATGTMSGTFAHWGGSTGFNLTWVYGAAVVTTSSGATGAGSFVVTSPVGNPCGGPATARFTGYIAGP